LPGDYGPVRRAPREPATAPHGAMPCKHSSSALISSSRGWPHHRRASTRWPGRPIYVPPGNEVTPERIALGRKLYFDTRLSKDGTWACATCHDVSRGFTDHRSVSEGIGDHLGKRSAPDDDERGTAAKPVLDGRAPTLEEQAKLPISQYPSRWDHRTLPARWQPSTHRSRLPGSVLESPTAARQTMTISAAPSPASTAHPDLSRCAVRPLCRRRRHGAVARRPARPGAVHRQSTLRQLPHDNSSNPLGNDNRSTTSACRRASKFRGIAARRSPY